MFFNLSVKHMISNINFTNKTLFYVQGWFDISSGHFYNFAGFQNSRLKATDTIFLNVYCKPNSENNSLPTDLSNPNKRFAKQLDWQVN